MNELPVYAVVIVVSLVGFNVAFLALGGLFDYPAILRRPAAEILERYRAGGRPLRATWYAFMASGLLFTVVPLLLHPIFEERGAQPAMLATGLGLLANRRRASPSCSARPRRPTPGPTSAVAARPSRRMSR